MYNSISGLSNLWRSTILTMATTTRFPLLGEPLALDLVNTRVRSRGETIDLLDRPAALDAWLRAQRDRVTWTGRTRPADLEAVRALRGTLDTLLRPRGRHAPPPAAIRSFNRVLAAPVPQPRLVWDGSAPRRSEPPARARRAILLHRIAMDALDLLDGPRAVRVRACAHPDCILLFVASDPRRRWCSSATCGNRARVARHYARGHGG